MSNTYIINEGPDATHFNLTTTEFNDYGDALAEYKKRVSENESGQLITLTKLVFAGRKPHRYVSYQEYKNSNFCSVIGSQPIDFIRMVERKNYARS